MQANWRRLLEFSIIYVLVPLSFALSYSIWLKLFVGLSTGAHLPDILLETDAAPSTL